VHDRSDTNTVATGAVSHKYVQYFSLSRIVITEVVRSNCFWILNSGGPDRSFFTHSSVWKQYLFCGGSVDQNRDIG